MFSILLFTSFYCSYFRLQISCWSIGLAKSLDHNVWSNTGLQQAAYSATLLFKCASCCVNVQWIPKDPWMDEKFVLSWCLGMEEIWRNVGSHDDILGTYSGWTHIYWILFRNSLALWCTSIRRTEATIMAVKRMKKRTQIIQMKSKYSLLI